MFHQLKRESKQVHDLQIELPLHAELGNIYHMVETAFQHCSLVGLFVCIFGYHISLHIWNIICWVGYLGLHIWTYKRGEFASAAI
jgi:hypothetical protein